MKIKQNKFLRIVAKVITWLLISLIVSAIGYYFLWMYPRYTVPVLTYHYFGYETSPDKWKRLLFVTPENFEKQMRYLSDKHYNVISLDELVKGTKSGRKFPHNTVVITIDDGHESIFTYGYPVFKKYGFPVTVFLISDYIGSKKDYLNWDEVNEMMMHNISFGGHTKHHVYLPEIKNEEILSDEIAGCKKNSESHISGSVDYFSYPEGGFNERIKMFVKKAGFKGACATNRGCDAMNKTDPYEFNRVSIRNSNPYFSLSNLLKPVRFRAKLSGYYNLYRKRKRGD